MKFNLKNRPDMHTIKQWVEVKEWFEGFEKELREKQQWLFNMRTHSSYLPTPFKDERGYRSFYTEKDAELFKFLSEILDEASCDKKVQGSGGG